MKVYLGIGIPWLAAGMSDILLGGLRLCELWSFFASALFMIHVFINCHESSNAPPGFA